MRQYFSGLAGELKELPDPGRRQDFSINEIAISGIFSNLYLPLASILNTGCPTGCSMPDLFSWFAAALSICTKKPVPGGTGFCFDK